MGKTNLDKYDSTSERLDDATFEERLAKFTKIFYLLQIQGIEVTEVAPAAVVVEDKKCGFKLTHGLMSWEVFRVVDVADMIISARNEYLERLERKNKTCQNLNS